MAKLNAARAIRLNAITNLIPPAAGILSAPILARGLGVADRGEVAGLTVPLTMAATALTFGLPEAMTYFSGRDRVAHRRYLGTAAVVLFFLGFAICAALLLFGEELGYGAAARNALLITAVSLPPLMILAVVRGAAAGLGYWRRISAERTVTSVCRLALLAGLLVTGNLTVVSAVGAIAITTLLGYGCYLGMKFTPQAVGGASTPPFRPLSRYAARAWPGALAGALVSRIDQLLMVPLATSQQLGIYAVAITLSEASLVVSNAVRDVIFASESQGRNVDRVALAARLSVATTFTISVFVAILAVPTVPLVFGAEFAGAVPVLLVLLPAGVLGAAGSVAAAALSGWDRAAVRSVGLVAAVVTKVGALVILVPAIGALGAAIATLIGAGTVWLVTMAVMFRDYGVRPTTLLVPRKTDLKRALAGLRR